MGRYKIYENTAERSFYLMTKHNCINRGMVFTLTQEDYINIIKRNCYYCGIEPFKKVWKVYRHYIYTSYVHGIDRVDNKKGYTLENCVSCCKHCNRAKSSLTTTQFYYLIKRIYQYKKLDKFKLDDEMIEEVIDMENIYI